MVIGTDADGVDDLAERNVFAGEFSYGVYVNGNDENRISGNTFGLAADGVTPLDRAIGVYLRQSSGGNLIGVLEDGVSDELEPNVFAACNEAIWLDAADGGVNAVLGNRIGVDAQVDPAPNVTGLRVTGAGIGYQIQGNLFVSNVTGLRIEDAPGFAETDGNCFLGNDIGLEHAGTAAVDFANSFWAQPTDRRGPDLGRGIRSS